ncbi:taurine ABC transporter ATP-binding protein [Carnimonas bestiolae]|uniref:taurine ABC transporter ATP-binding protein n=1 Tax=Carnimonas bestiolae TaxID=3402172 RepID=UPI003EDCAFF1
MSELIAEGISVSYPTGNGRKRVLEPLNVRIQKGESVVVLGPSGCGKSTLLNVLAGFLAPDSGRILLDGKELTSPGGERGVVFQDDALMPWLNARDNVALGLRIAGIGRHTRRQQATQLLDQVGLVQFADQRPAELSGGQRQRLGLARALAVDPDFLLLDEPFGALDALTRERMQGMLLELWRDTGKGIFMITHSIEEALLLATDLVVMGGPPGRVVEHKALGFAQRFINGESPRALRGDPEFVRHREHINQLLDDMSQQAQDDAPSAARAGN